MFFFCLKIYVRMYIYVICNEFPAHCGHRRIQHKAKHGNGEIGSANERKHKSCRQGKA